MLIEVGGVIDLSHSVIVPTRITNLGGAVQCHPTECLPICTTCRDDYSLMLDDVDELPRVRAAHESTLSLTPVLLVCALVTLALSGGSIVWRRRRHCATNSPVEQQPTGIEMHNGFPTEPLLFDCASVAHFDCAERPTARTSAPVLLSVHPSYNEASDPGAALNISFGALRSSPAPIFVVDAAMQIVLWSRGAV